MLTEVHVVFMQTTLPLMDQLHILHKQKPMDIAILINLLDALPGNPIRRAKVGSMLAHRSNSMFNAGPS